MAGSVNQELLPWLELIRDSTVFPTVSLDAQIDVSNDEIVDFLIGSQEPLQKALATCATIQSAKGAWCNKQVKHTIRFLQRLESSNWPGWEESAKQILAKLKQLDGHLLNDASFRQILNEIQTLCESAKFFTSLVGVQAFTGALHCEACLASLLNKTEDVDKSILAQMQVGYVSNLFQSSESHFL